MQCVHCNLQGGNNVQRCITAVVVVGLQGLKRERREAAGDAKARKRGKAAQPETEDADEDEADE
jgi:rRNA-processing protein FCF1